ncbi:MAG: DinB family protein [Chloroflexi bacterium]|nr:DinB family protein [Chloroflexota bacterium]
MSRPASVNDPSALRAVLAENLAELTALLDAVSGADLDVRLGDGEWSVREIVLHLLHAERWLLPQLTELRRAVAPGLPLPPADVVALPTLEEHPEENELRWAVRAVRAETEALLNGMTARQLREPANLSVDGETVDLSFRTMLLTAADHQLFHVRQIERTLGRAAPR